MRVFVVIALSILVLLPIFPTTDISLKVGRNEIGINSITLDTASINKSTINTITNYFVPNVGQNADPSVLFLTKGIAFRAKEIIFCIQERKLNNMISEPGDVKLDSFSTYNPNSNHLSVYRIDFPGANLVVPFGNNKFPGRYNLFLGNDPSKWVIGAPIYSEIIYKNLYEGIDLHFNIHANAIKYEFNINPGADLSKIHVRYSGVNISLDNNDILIRTPVGIVHDSGLIFYQDVPDKKNVIIGNISLEDNIISYQAKYDPGHTLIIDPLLFSSYLGGRSDDAYSDMPYYRDAIGADSQGNIIVAGTTSSDNFPTMPGNYDFEPNGMDDIFITKFDPCCTKLLFSTYIGGQKNDAFPCIKLGPSDNIFVTGFTNSPDFPTTSGAYNRSLKGSDAFIAKLSADGSRLIYSSFLGGNSADWGNAVDVDVSGNAYITGGTGSNDFPTSSGVYKTNYNSLNDIFITKINPNGTGLVLSTTIGGKWSEEGQSIRVNQIGEIYVTGSTDSTDFPTTAGMNQTILAGNNDTFLLKLSSDGTCLLQSTLIGGTGPDYCADLALDLNNSVYLVGYTASDDFPTTNDCMMNTKVYPGQWKGFAIKISPDFTQIVYSTFIGGTSGGDYCFSNILAADGSMIVVGETLSNDLQVTDDAAQKQLAGYNDAFIIVLNSTGTGPNYYSYLGGSFMDAAFDVTRASPGCFCIAGYTRSSDFPTTTDAYSRTISGGFDAFITAFSMPDGPAPLNLTAIAGNQHVLLTWESPQPPGFPPIMDFRIYRGDHSDKLSLLAIIGNVSVYNDTGLLNGKTYYYMVSAVWIGGEGAKSQLHAATPGTIPNPPLNIKLDVGNRLLNLSWDPPASDGGSQILKYIIYRSVNMTAMQRYSQMINSTRMTDKEVFNTSLYSYSISAVNFWGEGNKSTIVNGSPGWSPSPPRNIIAWGDGPIIHLSWDKPLDADRCPPISYIIYCQNGSSPRLTFDSGGELKWHDQLNQSEKRMRYNITAYNAYGQSEHSSDIILNCPSAPLNLTVISGPTGTEMNWKSPENDGGCTVFRYNIYRSIQNGSEIFLFSTLNASTSTIIDKAEYNTSIGYSISAVNAIGESEHTNLIFAFHEQTRPTLVVTEPANGTYLNKTIVTFKGTAYDITGIKLVEFSSDNISWSQCNGTESWQTTLTLPEGRTIAYIKGTNVLGNVAIVQSIITIDLTPPNIMILDPKEGSYAISEQQTVEGLISDNSGISDIQLNVDNGSWTYVASTGNNWSGIALLMHGVNIICVHATDRAGNQNQSKVKVLLDIQSPTITIHRPKPGEHFIIKEGGHRINVLFKGNATDDLGVRQIELSVDNEIWIAANGTENWSGILPLTEGNHKIIIRASDYANHQSITELIVIVEPPSNVSTNTGFYIFPIVIIIIGLLVGLLLYRVCHRR